MDFLSNLNHISSDKRPLFVCSDENLCGSVVRLSVLCVCMILAIKSNQINRNEIEYVPHGNGKSIEEMVSKLVWRELYMLDVPLVLQNKCI